MKTVILIIVLNLNFLGLFGQNWQKGKLILSKGGILEGEVSYYVTKQIILFKNEVQVQAFEVNQVKELEYFDTHLQLKRYFAHYPFGYKNTFFERILMGTFHLLKLPARNYYLNENNQYYEYFDRIQDYYLWNGKKIIKIKNFKKQFKALFLEYQLNLKQLIKTKKLKTYLLITQIKLVQTLNQAIEKQKMIIHP